MAYNLRSLAYSINQILHPVPQFPSVDELEKEKLESLLKKVNTLQETLENLPLPTYNRLKTFERQVIDLSHRAEDIVDSAIVNRTLKEKARETLLQDLQILIKEIDSFINKDLTFGDPTSRFYRPLWACPNNERLEMLQRQVIDLSQRSEDIVDSANVDRTLFALSAEGKSSTWSPTKSFRSDLRKVTETHFSDYLHRSYIPDSSKKEKAGETLRQVMLEEATDMRRFLETLQRYVIDSEDTLDSDIVQGGGESSKPSVADSSSREEPGETFLQDLSHRAEDTVDSAIVNQVSIQQKGFESSSTSSIPYCSKKEDLQKLIEELDSLINKYLTIVDSSQQQTVIEEFEDLPIMDSSQQQTVIQEFDDPTVVDPTPESSLFIFTSKGLPRTSKRVARPLPRTKKHVAKPLPRTKKRAGKGVDESQACKGLDKDIPKLRGQLTRLQPSHLEVISIVGMGGIGKTFLAQKLYHDPSIVSHYDCRAWVTISQVYEVGTIISTLLSCLPKDQEERDDPSVRLHKALYNRRYLIVLDDIWSTKILGELRKFFPDDGKNSTIILTTRDQEVAAYANPSILHSMQLLGPDDSWDLFCVKVFGERKWPDPKLENLGRKIVKHCKGLPLAISVISGLLLECDNSEGFWDHVANDISPTVALDEQFSKIFSLSYDHLPHHLRPCLLYLGTFAKGAKIRVCRIKRLWAAESFLKLIENKTPEEAAEQYLEDLKNRNLVVVREMKSCGKVKSYGMHDLLNDLCIRRAEEEDFVVCREHEHVRKALDRSTDAQSLRRVVLNNRSNFEGEIEEQFHIDNPAGDPSSRYHTDHDIEDYIYREVNDMVCELLSTSKLVRVLDASKMRLLYGIPEEIFQLVNIRYLSLDYELVHPLLSRLWNLETLLFYSHGEDLPVGIIDIPDEIWKLRKLKHFKIIGEWLIGRVELHSALETLQTLSLVSGKTSMANLIQRVPNIKKLGLCWFKDAILEDIDMSRLHNLENSKIENIR